MNWQGRWREMLLAGGVVAVAACSGSQVTSTGDASDDGAGSGSSGGSSAGLGGGSASGGGCCNANGDPCCAYLYCDGGLTPTCSDELACKADGGNYNPYQHTQPDGTMVYPGCSLSSEAGLDATPDSAPAEAADAPAGDSAADAGTDVVIGPFCCNANGDPCCQYRYCGGALTPACSAEIACQADGGTYDPYQITQPDGSIVYPSCTFPSEAGTDAAPDSDTPEAGDAGGG